MKNNSSKFIDYIQYGILIFVSVVFFYIFYDKFFIKNEGFIDSCWMLLIPFSLLLNLGEKTRLKKRINFVIIILLLIFMVIQFSK